MRLKSRRPDGAAPMALAAMLATAVAAAPCDIYAAANAPCVAAHSTTRALYANYSGTLYRVRRSSDNSTFDVGTRGAGGVADVAAMEAFCGRANCSVLRIFDQSPMANHLDTAPPGEAANHTDAGVNATAAPFLLAGRKVHCAKFEGGMGYRIEKTRGIAVADEPESMYMVVDGRHYNDRCCFDYGNAETDAQDHGKGTMEAIYWGNSTGWSRGQGKGPWVMADIENGLWAGKDKVSAAPSIDADFVTAMAKGYAGGFQLKGGDAQKAGALATLYSGPRPPHYNPMRKQGAIILGIGGDNSDWAVGTFCEGVMTQGFSSDAADAAVHANIAAAGYADLKPA